MTIIKILKDDRSNFLIIDKSVLEIETLSWDAKGLWAYLMSKPKSWEVSVAHLSQNFTAGRDKIYRLLNELMNHGICERDQPFIKNQEGKKFKGKMETTIYEQPQQHILDKIQKKILVPENPEAEKPEADFATQVSIDNSKYRKEREGTNDFFEFKRISMKMEAYEKLKEDFGESKISEMLERLDEYADINPKKFNQYANHSTVIRKWIREDKNKSPVQPSHKSKDIVSILQEKYPHLFRTGEIQKLDNSIAFVKGSFYLEINYNDANFMSTLIRQLSKMGYDSSWII